MNAHIPTRLRPLLIAAAVAVLSCSSDEGLPDEPEVSWIQAHAVPLSTADPSVAEPNFAALADAIGDARLVGLGEATHGTRDFWQMRQKISKYLVEEMGFTAILHEAGFPNSLPLHDYVTTGSGDVDDAHQRLGSWRYLEMRELIHWMRDYNEQAAGQRPLLHYYGYDCAFADWTEASRVITDYLALVDAAVVAEATERLDRYTTDDAEWVVDLLASNRGDYVALEGEEAYDLVLRIAENLVPNWTLWYNLRNGIPEMDVREETNLTNVNWIVEHLLDGGKAVIWAHNFHVGNTYLEDSGTEAQMVGSRLRAQHGDDYYVIATEFYGGSFQAWDACPGHEFTFTVHQAAAPSSDTYAAHFHQEALPLFYLDLRGADYALPGAGRIMGPWDLRYIGASYCAQYDTEFTRPASLPEEFDGIVYFETTTPTTRITLGP